MTLFSFFCKPNLIYTSGSDNLIGCTTVDLEDRWFDARWQKMGEENVLMPGDEPNDPTKVCLNFVVV